MPDPSAPGPGPARKPQFGDSSQRATRRGGAPTAAPADTTARQRFRQLDDYRVRREWDRYEGTAQRKLFRELRTRFLDRHAAQNGWVLDLGSGPGRFLPHIGRSACRRVALDLSVEMLRQVERDGRTPPELVRGDGVRPPFQRAAFQEVVVLGNALGFAGEEADRMWPAAGELLRPGGSLILEIVAGAGERARYLCRLPASSLGRLFHSPVAALVARVEREGYALDPPRRSDPGSFRRYDPDELKEAIVRRGWWVEEVMAVAPALGGDRERLEGIVSDPIAWAHLLDLEEAVGHREERARRAAAVLIAVRIPPLPNA